MLRNFPELFEDSSCVCVCFFYSGIHQRNPCDFSMPNPQANWLEKILKFFESRQSNVSKWVFGLFLNIGRQRVGAFSRVEKMPLIDIHLDHQRKATHLKNTHPNKKQFAQVLSGQICSACLKKKRGTVCTNCSEIVCANCVFIWAGCFFGVCLPLLHEQREV